MMKHFKKGGIHPDPCKITAGGAVRRVESPAIVNVMLSQSIGAPARAVVKPGQAVNRGELIAEASGFVSSPIHSPVNGIVKKLEPVRDAQGIWRPAVVIEREEVGSDEYGRHKESDCPDSISAEEIIRKVGDMGVVGAGGATFPTRVKLSVPDGKKVDFVLLNGAECEPYLTCDDTLMRRKPIEILRGMRYIMKATGASRGIVGIEANKPQAIAAMRDAADRYPEIEVDVLRTAYPQGSEKQLIEALTGRRVPAGRLPLDVGVIVDNVATAYNVMEAVELDKPVIERLVTVTGPALTSPGDFLVPVGTPISTLIEAAGGLPDNTGKIIAGGPMMGRAVSNPDAPSVKGMSGVLVLPMEMSRREEAKACIRCGACVRACPMGLEPYLLMTYGERDMDEEARAADVLSCLECGSCSYVCPSARPILDYIRLSRTRLRSKK